MTNIKKKHSIHRKKYNLHMKERKKERKKERERENEREREREREREKEKERESNCQVEKEGYIHRKAGRET